MADTPIAVGSGALHAGNVGLHFQGYTPQLLTNREPAVVALTTTGAAPLLGMAIAVPTGSLSVSSDAPALVVAGYSPAIDTLSLSGGTPSLIRGTIRAPPVVALSTAASAPTLEIHYATGAGSITFGGDAVSLVSGNIELPAAKALSFTGNAPILNTGVSPATLALTFSSDVNLLTTGIAGTLGTLTFTGQQPVIPITIKFGETKLSFDSQNVSFAEPGIAIVNPDATTSVRRSVEECSLSGLEQLPGSLKYTWRRSPRRKKSWDPQHPQEQARRFVSRERRKKGSPRQEQPDLFIGDQIAEVTKDDL